MLRHVFLGRGDQNITATPATAERRTAATGPTPYLKDAAPPVLLMFVGVADPDELLVVAGVVAVDTAWLVAIVAVPVPVDVDDAVEVVCAPTEKSPLVARTTLMLLY